MNLLLLLAFVFAMAWAIFRRRELGVIAACCLAVWALLLIWPAVDSEV